MTAQLHPVNRVVSFAIFVALSIAIMLMTMPTQAGGYYQYGYGHHGGHHAYGYSYGYPLFYGLSYGHRSYRHSYYGYGHRYPYRPGYRYYSPAPVYQDRTYDRGSAAISPAVTPAANNQGWSLLSNNQASAALNDFGRQAQAAPSKGDPKIGYALASADLGQLDRGVWAMRRALKADPGALHYVALDQKLDTKVKQMIQQYEKQLAYSPRDTDAAFMLASLHYLRHDMEAARNNIDQAMLARSISSSTKNLRELIDKEMEG